MDLRKKLLAFTETLIFTDDLLRLAGDDTLYAIQNALLENPLLGDVIKGTSGARKGRTGDPNRRLGKSGGLRFIYIYLEKNERFYLLSIYSKKENTDLTPQQAVELGHFVREIKKIYNETE